MLVWAIALVWTVTGCYLMGYNRAANDIVLLLGFPDWVFWGICLPWGLCLVFSVWFCFFTMADDDLGEDPEEGPVMADLLMLGADGHAPSTLVAFFAYMAGVFLLGILSHHLLKRGSFLKEYFLGDRKLNAWVLGLTYVATSVSAGTCGLSRR